MMQRLLFIFLVATVGCDTVATVGLPGTTCTGTPQIMPSPLPRITRGQVLTLSVRSTCTGPAPAFAWRIDNSNLVSLNSATGDTVRLTAVANGAVNITTYWLNDSTYRASATLVIADTVIPSLDARYNLEAVGGQALPYTMQLTGPDIVCLSSQTSQGVFDAGTLTFASNRTHQFTFAWTRVCIASDGTRNSFPQSSSSNGTYAVQGDSVFITQAAGETWKGAISGTEFRMTFRLPPNPSGYPDTRATPTTTLVYRRQ